MTGYPGSYKDLSTESILDAKAELVLTVEEGRALLTKILSGINKKFARLDNVLFKYLGKFGTLLLNIFTNLEKTKNKIKEEIANGAKIETKNIEDDTILKWRSMTLLGVLTVSADKKPLSAFQEIIDNYSDKNFASNFIDKLMSMLDDSKELDSIYDNKDVLRKLERRFSKKIKNFFCKSTTADRMILGANYNSVYILERCKPLHITAKINPYNYSINTLAVEPQDIFGSSVEFPTPTEKEMLGLLDAGMQLVKNRKSIVNDIHNVMKNKKGEMDKIDENSTWENIKFYSVLPTILLILSKTYADLPSGIDSLGKIFLKELKAS